MAEPFKEFMYEHIANVHWGRRLFITTEIRWRPDGVNNVSFSAPFTYQNQFGPVDDLIVLLQAAILEPPPGSISLQCPLQPDNFQDARWTLSAAISVLAEPGALEAALAEWIASFGSGNQLDGTDFVAVDGFGYNSRDLPYEGQILTFNSAGLVTSVTTYQGTVPPSIGTVTFDPGV